jgi:hypothetical protein
MQKIIQDTEMYKKSKLQLNYEWRYYGVRDLNFNSWKGIILLNDVNSSLSKATVTGFPGPLSLK